MLVDWRAAAPNYDSRAVLIVIVSTARPHSLLEHPSTVAKMKRV
jgi:hypothetical protein